MAHNTFAKIIHIGNSVGVILPVYVCRELKIVPGTFWGLRVMDMDTIVLARVMVVEQYTVGEQRDTKLPIIKNGK